MFTEGLVQIPCHQITRSKTVGGCTICRGNLPFCHTSFARLDAGLGCNVQRAGATCVYKRCTLHIRGRGHFRWFTYLAQCNGAHAPPSYRRRRITRRRRPRRRSGGTRGQIFNFHRACSYTNSNYYLDIFNILIYYSSRQT